MSSKHKKSDSEIDEENTYNNYIKGLNYCLNIDVVEAIKMMSETLDINEIGFQKLCLGEYYYSKYFKEAISISREIIQKTAVIINKNKLAQGNVEYLIFWKEKLEKVTNEIIEFSKPEINTKLSKNLYPNIFSGDFAYTLFLKNHEVYKNSKTIYTANYSFIYYAMKKDKLTICTGSDFRNFLSEYINISIDRIDSKQYGRKNKQDLYESIKSAL